MRTAEGKWVLFDLATGAQGEYWPIDARPLLAAGTHATEAPAGVTPVPPVLPPERVGVPRTPVATIHEVTRESRAPEELPPGYTIEHQGAGYYTLTAPDGSIVEGPSRGKFQGKDGAVAGARAHLSS